MKKTLPKTAAPGSPLPDYFHPKDSPSGIVARLDSGCGAWANMARGTVFCSLGGVTLEMTPKAARGFVLQIQCAIDCASKADRSGAQSDV